MTYFNIYIYVFVFVDIFKKKKKLHQIQYITVFVYFAAVLSFFLAKLCNIYSVMCSVHRRNDFKYGDVIFLSPSPALSVIYSFLYMFGYSTG